METRGLPTIPIYKSMKLDGIKITQHPIQPYDVDSTLLQGAVIDSKDIFGYLQPGYSASKGKAILYGTGGEELNEDVIFTKHLIALMEIRQSAYRIKILDTIIDFEREFSDTKIMWAEKTKNLRIKYLLL